MTTYKSRWYYNRAKINMQGVVMMSKTVVIYQSKYGATQKYAQWLAKALFCEAVERKKFSEKRFADYDTIIYGAGIYGTGIAGISWLKKNATALTDKLTVCFAVGASPFEASALEEIKKKNLKDELESMPCFYCRGAFDEQRMTTGDKLLISMLKKMVAKKDPAAFEPWEAALMESIGKAGDWTDEKNLEPIISYVKSFN